MFRPLFFLAVIGTLALSATPGQPVLQTTERVQLDVPYYSQRDGEWGEEELGDSDLTIGTDGCGITSAAMVLEYYDLQFNPDEINDAFNDHEGFSGALMIWAQNDAWMDATDDQIQGVSQYWEYDEDVLVTNLDHGRPVVVYLDGRHYVVVTGYETVDDPERPGETMRQFYINDPWAEDAAGGKNIQMEDNVLEVDTNITQMNVLHTDPVLPVTGFLVDWPAIQSKYASLGGLEGRLGPPLEDDGLSHYADASREVEVRSQMFENGKIYAYKPSGQDSWRAAWIPKEINDVYQEHQHGLLLGDVYANSTIGGAFVVRADAEQASFVYQPWDKKLTVVTKQDGIYAEYFPNHNLEGNHVLTRYEKDLNFAWQDGPTHPELTNEYSVRFRYPFNTNVPWSRTFVVSARGGVRAYLDEKLMFDEWNNPTPGYIEITKWIGRGEHEWVIEYRNTSDSSVFMAAFTEWPVKIAFAEGGYGAFEGKPDSIPPLEIEPVEITPPPPAAQVIDDLDPQFSFVEGSRNWEETLEGYNQHSYWSNGLLSGSDVAEWRISNLAAGEYELFVYIPVSTTTTTNEASYKILTGLMETTTSIDQKEHQNEWMDLGTYSVEEGNDLILQLSSTSGRIAADAVAYLQISTTPWSDEISQTFEEWWNAQVEKIEKAVNDWWESQRARLEQAIQEWWEDTQRRLVEWLQTELEKEVNKLCFGGIIPLLAVATIMAGKLPKNRKHDPYE